MTQHRAIEIELPDHLSRFGAVVALLRAVRDATLARGTLTPPEINAAADELLAWFERQEQRAAAAVAEAVPALLTLTPGRTEDELAEWLRELGEHPRSGNIFVGIDYGFAPVDQAPPVDEPGQS